MLPLLFSKNLLFGLMVLFYPLKYAATYTLALCQIDVLPSLDVCARDPFV